MMPALPTQSLNASAGVMAVTFHQFPDYGLNMMVIRGRVTGPDLIAALEGVDPGDPGNSATYLNYVDPSADLAEIDLASVTELKRTAAAKIREIFQDRHVVSVIVSDSRDNDPIVRLWTSYVGHDHAHPSTPRLVSTLKAACEYLKLPQKAYKRLAETISALGRSGERESRSA